MPQSGTLASQLSRLEVHHVPHVCRSTHPSLLETELVIRRVERGRSIVQQAVQDAWLTCLEALSAAPCEESGLVATVASRVRQRTLLLEAARQAVWAELIDQSPDTQRERLLALGITALFHGNVALTPVAQSLHASSSSLRHTLLAARARCHAILETLLSWSSDLPSAEQELLRAQLFDTAHDA